MFFLLVCASDNAHRSKQNIGTRSYIGTRNYMHAGTLKAYFVILMAFTVQLTSNVHCT